jgi:hypothetical protein
MAGLTIDEIHDLHAAAVEAGLARSRDALVAGIAVAFVSGVPLGQNASEQILIDLNACNDAGELSDGSFPLEIWLKNATMLAGGRVAAEVFRRALQKLAAAKQPERLGGFGTSGRFVGETSAETKSSAVAKKKRIARGVPAALSPKTGRAAASPASIERASINDQPSAADALNFRPHVRAVAEFLRNRDTRPPLTLSVEGPWGAGKSSFMLQLGEMLASEEVPLRRRIREAWAAPGGGSGAAPSAWAYWSARVRRLGRAASGDRQIVVRFDAWRQEKSDQLWAAFAIEFLSQVAEQRSFPRRLWGHAWLFMRRVGWRSAWLDILRVLALAALALGVVCALAATMKAYAGTLAVQNLMSVMTAVPAEDKRSPVEKALGALVKIGGFGGFVALAATVALKVRSVAGGTVPIDMKKYIDAPGYESRATFIDQFHKDFGKILGAYAGHRRVCVLVDDLDRCEVPRAADLMQAINLMISSDPRLIFIIGMDREKVAAGIAAKYKDLIPFLRAAPSVPRVGAKPLPTGTSAPAAAAALDPDRAIEFGYEFLEKFIQLPFAVPRATEREVIELIHQTSRGTPAYVGRAPGRTGAEVASSPAPVDPRSDGGATRAAELDRFASNISTDSDLVRDIAVKVSPVLDYNPRRIKQFINFFRLRAYIAYRTGSLRLPGEDERDGAVTLQQLGKLTAMALRWPLLLSDLDVDPGLLARLQAYALGAGGAERDNGPTGRWFSREKLTHLLRLGGSPSGPDEGDEWSMDSSFDLQHVESVRVLLAQPYTRAARTAIPNAAANEEAGVPLETQQRDAVVVD